MRLESIEEWAQGQQLELPEWWEALRAEAAAREAAHSTAQLTAEELMHARQALVPGSRQITREQKIRFLDRIAAGERHDVAARQVGSTGTRFRWLERNDPEFNRAYLQATEEAPRGLQDRIRKEIGERMFDRSDPSSARLLVLEAEAHLPEYEHRRTRHLKHSGGLTVQAIPFIDQAKLEALPDDRFELFMGVLREIVSDREPIQLPAGNQLPVIEAA